jgi:hypothetical protein
MQKAKASEYLLSTAHRDTLARLTHEAKGDGSTRALLDAMAQTLQYELQTNKDRSVPCPVALENLMRVVIVVLQSSEQSPPKLDYVIEKLNIGREGVVIHCMQNARVPT